MQPEYKTISKSLMSAQYCHKSNSKFSDSGNFGDAQQMNRQEFCT